MTIQNENNKMNYIGDGIVTVYAYNFRVDRAEDMSVYLDDVLTGTGWTIDGLGDPNGGNVTFSVAPADQVKITLLREIAIEQLVDYVPYDAFPAETHEGALDKLTMICQQLQEASDRALSLAPSTPASVDRTFPPYAADEVIKWDASEEKLVTTDEWGIPQGTRLVFYQASPPVGWTLIDVGDVVVAISNGSDKLYSGANPGNLSGSWQITGLTADVTHIHQIYRSNVGESHQIYNNTGALQDVISRVSQAGETPGIRLTDADGQPVFQANTLYTDRENLIQTVISDSSWRPSAAVCLVAQKD